MSYLLSALLFLTAVFLIVLVLIQRGKGGGLAGALGGMGGQSAFGTKAGDLFTRITIGVATVWIILCMIAVKFYSGGPGLLSNSSSAKGPGQPAPATAPQTPGSTPAGKAAPVPAVPASPAGSPTPSKK